MTRNVNSSRSNSKHYLENFMNLFLDCTKYFFEVEYCYTKILIQKASFANFRKETKYTISFILFISQKNEKI